ncbi:MAG: SDR family oxidoreductase [Candidatus Hodarchaeales archaeon]|jgi:NAD(P)-dependent dehydrogenase (short-subunit alcohol dehydrogenase family)
MSKKTIAITGANSGIGKAAAIILAKENHRIIMLCRSKSSSEKVRQEIVKKTNNSDIHLIILDLASQKSINEAVNQFKSQFDALDVLINNAGINLFKRQENENGYEKVFATNHLGPFLLTNLLLDNLKKSGTSRIINVASAAQSPIDFEDIMSEKSYNPMRVYARSKLANIMFTYELAERVKNHGITVNSVHPGLVRTNLTRDLNIIFKIAFAVFKPFLRSPEKGAETLVYLATNPEVANITGKYFVDKKEKQSRRESYNESDIKRLWNISNELTALNA